MILDGQFCETTIGCEDRELGVLFKSMFQTPNFRVSRYLHSTVEKMLFKLS